LGMYLGELETCVRLKSDMLLVVFADSSLELIRRSQVVRHLPTIGTSFTNPDFTHLGKAFGIPVHIVSSPGELRKAAGRVREAQGVQMIVAEIDGDDYVF
jgi:acetolactate synthase I/II/III large subunit